MNSIEKTEDGMPSHESIRAAGGIVHRDGNIFFTNIEQLRRALAASAQSVVALPSDDELTSLFDSIRPNHRKTEWALIAFAHAALAKWGAATADPSPVGREQGEAEQVEGYTARVIEALYENGDPVSVDAAEELKRLAALATPSHTTAPADFRVLKGHNAGEVLLNLLAAIHRDGGHHTNRVGLRRSVKDAVALFHATSTTAPAVAGMAATAPVARSGYLDLLHAMTAAVEKAGGMEVLAQSPAGRQQVILACANVAAAPQAQGEGLEPWTMRPMTCEGKGTGYYLDGPDGIYCDIEPEGNGEWSIFFRSRRASLYAIAPATAEELAPAVHAGTDARDAARYRWLRSDAAPNRNGEMPWCTVRDSKGYAWAMGAALDEHIDAALAASGTSQEGGAA